MNFRRFFWVAPLTATLTAGCFATRNDVRLLKADIERMHNESETARKADADRLRAEQAKRDTLTNSANRRLEESIRHLADTLRTLADGLSRFNATQASAINDIQIQIATIQEIVGVTQKQMAAANARSEAQREASAARSDSGAAEGPLLLYQVGRDQLGKGAFGQARGAFQEMIDKFPNDKLVPDAMYQIGQTYSGEKQDAKADSVFAAILRKYPTSDRAPGALYKRAYLNQEAGRTDEARRLYNQLIKDYSASDEARQAKVRITELPKR